MTASLDQVIQKAVLAAHPVGSYYWSEKETDPADLFGGIWEAIHDKFVYAAGTRIVGATGGEETHTLTVGELPAHTHSATTASSGAHLHKVGTYNNNNSNYKAPARSVRLSSDWNNVEASTASSLGKTEDGYGYGDFSGYTTKDGAHTHTVNVANAGGGGYHNNMPPYVVAYCWKRIE